MKNSTLIVRIPEPCHEDWNKMTPDDKGRFCGSCSKSVFDFSTKTDNEVQDILLANKDQKICGHFKKSQINRPLNITIDLRSLPKNMSVTKIFTIALFLAFGTFLFSCTGLNGEKINSIEMSKPLEENNIVGAMQIAPQELLKGNAVTKPDSMTQQTIYEEMVDGGVSYHEIIPEENLLEKGDMVVEDTVYTIPEPTYLRGAICVINHCPTIDSSEVQKPDSILTKDIIENTGTFLNKKSELTVYPNPGKGEFTIKYEVVNRSDVRVDVFDMNGMLLKNIVNVNDQYMGRYNIPVNLSELPDGTYIVSIINNGKRFTEKLIITR